MCSPEVVFQGEDDTIECASGPAGGHHPYAAQSFKHHLPGKPLSTAVPQNVLCHMAACAVLPRLSAGSLNTSECLICVFVITCSHACPADATVRSVHPEAAS